MLFPAGDAQENAGWLSIYLELVAYDIKPIQVDFGFDILNKDRAVVVRQRNFTKKFLPGIRYGAAQFIKREVALAPTSDLLINNELHIVCSIKWSTTNGVSISTKPNILAQLSDEFEQLFECSDKFTDVTLVCRGGVSIPAHKHILSARSPVFRAMFERDTKENQENTVTIPDIDQETLRAVLRFMYSGKINEDLAKSYNLLIAASKYVLDGLKAECENRLSENLKAQNAVECLTMAEIYSAGGLKAKALQFIRKHLRDVTQSPDFMTLSGSHPNLLQDILQNLGGSENSEGDAAKRRRLSQ